LLVLHRGEEKRIERALLEIILDRAFSKGLTVRALKDLYILVPVNWWKFQQLVRGEGIGETTLGREPVKFLGFGNSNVLEQQTWEVAIRKAMDCHSNAMSYGAVVAFSSWDMLALRGIVKLGIHVVFDVVEECLELDVGIN